MSDNEFQMTTARPVLVSYPHGEEPTPLHPNGIPAGFVTEAATPEVAYAFHPGGTILRYADGGEFSDRKARAEIKRRDELAEGAASGDAEAVETVKAARKRATGSTRGGTSRKAAREAIDADAAQNAAQALDEAQGGNPVDEVAVIHAAEESAAAAAEAEARISE